MNSLSRILVSIIGVLVIGLIGVLLYIYWPAITGTVNGSKYYTAEDVQEAYDEGYNDGNTSEKELNEKLAYYKSLVDDYYTEVDTLNGEINILNVDIANRKEQIQRLEEQKSELIAQVENLTTIKNDNETTISGLNNQIDTLQSQIADLSKSETDKSKEIARLTEQVNNLQSLSSQLQKTNELNVETINSLNNQIKSLNTQISEMNYLINNSGSIVSSLNAKIAELEKSVAYYEEYIASMESGEQVVATFELNGSVYNIQIVNKNDIVTVTTPTSTDYVIFNYWTVNGEKVDLSTFRVTTNTKFVANVTLKFDAIFKVDFEEYDKQIIEENGFATLPEAPTKDGYEFDGWVISGNEIVDVSSYKITQHTTFIAKFTQIHTVTYMYEEDILGTEEVRNGEYAKGIEVEDTTYKTFNGWTFNDMLISLDNYKITSSIVLKANIIYKYDVTFMVDDKKFETMIVPENNFASISSNPTKRGYEFIGWSLNKTDIVNIYTIKITENTTFYAMFNKIYEFETVEYKGLVNLTGQYVWNDGENVYYSYQEEQYEFNKETNTWTKKVWKGLENFSGLFIWTDGVETYYSYNGDNFVLNKNTSVWTKKTWSGLTKIDGRAIWSDGTNLYYTESGTHYVLNVETSTWTRKSWSGIGAPFAYYYLWFADGYVYSKNTISKYYRLNVAEDKWEEITMVEPDNYFNPSSIWVDGTDAYYGNYKFNTTTNSWDKITWNGISGISKDYIWHDSENNLYYSNGSIHYEYNREINTWKLRTWQGVSSFNTSYIWATTNNIYFSNGNIQYVLDKETNTWIDKTWNGLTSINASSIWTFEGKTYYMASTKYYILDESSSTWNLLHSNGMSITDSKYIWQNGETVYYTMLGTYELNKETMTWTQISDYDSNIIFGNCIWSDGENLYYSSVEEFFSTILGQYVFDKETNAWIETTWEELGDYSGRNVWTDGERIYYSLGYEQYVLNTETRTWEAMVWEGIESFDGEDVWTDGIDIYISNGIQQYKMK